MHSVSKLRLAAATVVFLVSFVRFLEALYARRSVAFLAGVSPEEDAPLGSEDPEPKLSVIVPASNEEGTLEPAVRSMLSQDYPSLEIVLVDDRSTDGTHRIMERLAAAHPNVRVVRIDELHEGWIGKNRAVSEGALRAGGDWLLFSDADVRFDHTAFRRAVAHADKEGLDHLALVPEFDLRGYWLNSFVAFFCMALLVHKGHYRANISACKTGVGIGAFNLIRRSTYEKIGTHEEVALNPVDDLSLGAVVKERGFEQRLLLGAPLVRVRWYDSLGDLIQGFEKNVFAELDYSPAKALFRIVALFAIAVWPFFAPLVARGSTLALYLGAAAANLGTFLAITRQGWKSLYLALGYPVCGLLFAYTIARSCLIVMRRGGICWRGTFYPLSVLRDAREARESSKKRKWIRLNSRVPVEAE